MPDRAGCASVETIIKEFVQSIPEPKHLSPRETGVRVALEVQLDDCKTCSGGGRVRKRVPALNMGPLGPEEVPMEIPLPVEVPCPACGGHGNLALMEICREHGGACSGR